MTCQAHSTLGTLSSFRPSIPSALCCCYPIHLMDCTPPPPKGGSQQCVHVRMFTPVHFTPLFVVCLSAPVLPANYVAEFRFLFFNRPQAGSALPMAFYPVIHGKDVDTSPFLLPPPMAENGT